MKQLGWWGVVVLAGCQFSTSTTLGTGPRTTSGESQNLTMPNLMLMTQAEAEAAVRAAGFERAPEVDNNSLCGSVVDKKIVDRGRVCSQAPAAGQVTFSRTPITIRVQTENPYGGELGGGRKWFLMPDLVGADVDQARSRLKQLGFVSKEVNVSFVDRPGCKPNVVCETYPEGLTRTDNTSDKLFYVGKPPDAPKPADPKKPPPPGKPDDIF